MKTVLHALEVAKAETKYPKVTWNFVRTILERYRNSGITSVEDALRNERMFNGAKISATLKRNRDKPKIPIYKLGE